MQWRSSHPKMMAITTVPPPHKTETQLKIGFFKMMITGIFSEQIIKRCFKKEAWNCEGLKMMPRSWAKRVPERNKNKSALGYSCFKVMVHVWSSRCCWRQLSKSTWKIHKKKKMDMRLSALALKEIWVLFDSYVHISLWFTLGCKLTHSGGSMYLLINSQNRNSYTLWRTLALSDLRLS